MRKPMLTVAVVVMGILMGCVQQPEVQVTKEGAVVLSTPIREMPREKPRVANGDSAQYVAVVDEWIVVKADSWEELIEKLAERPASQRLVVLYQPGAESILKYIAPGRTIY